MNRTQLVKKMKALLLRRRDALRWLLAGELSHIGTDEAFESLDDEAYFGVAERESHELERIGDTLERIRTGRYGVCEDCGQNISLARLEALPYASLCLKCQRETEAHGPRPIIPIRLTEQQETAERRDLVAGCHGGLIHGKVQPVRQGLGSSEPMNSKRQRPSSVMSLYDAMERQDLSTMTKN